ncbi:MAG TPA: OmpH family outer membrane protein [Vicinamibacterales bacterium]
MILELTLALALQSSGSPAQDGPYPSRVVNVPRLIAESIAGKAGTAKLKAVEEEKRKALADKQAAVQRLTQAKAAPAEIQRAQVELERATQDAETDFAALTRQMQVDFETRLTPILRQILDTDHIGIIFDYPQKLIVWASPAADITDEVIARLDAATKKP